MEWEEWELDPFYYGTESIYTLYETIWTRFFASGSKNLLKKLRGHVPCVLSPSWYAFGTLVTPLFRTSGTIKYHNGKRNPRDISYTVHLIATLWTLNEEPARCSATTDVITTLSSCSKFADISWSLIMDRVARRPAKGGYVLLCNLISYVLQAKLKIFEMPGFSYILRYSFCVLLL